MKRFANYPFNVIVHNSVQKKVLFIADHSGYGSMFHIDLIFQSLLMGLVNILLQLLKGKFIGNT